MEEGKGQGCLASSRQYGNALLGVRHQEEVCELSMHQKAVFTGRKLTRINFTLLAEKSS